jgi:hypothetical protein
VAARRVLLDALSPNHTSLVLIGAQAVYLHTGQGPYAAPPMTTDADLAIDADLLSDKPELATVMETAQFQSRHPWHWENHQGIAVDLMVDPHQAGTTRRTCARTPSAGGQGATMEPIGRGGRKGPS